MSTLEEITSTLRQYGKYTKKNNMRLACLLGSLLHQCLILFHSGLKDTEQMKEIITRLKAGKRYLSSDFKIHISRETPCTGHCSVFVLSSADATEYRETCSHEHNMSCNRCDDLKNAIVDLQLALSELHLIKSFASPTLATKWTMSTVKSRIVSFACEIYRYLFTKGRVRELSRVHSEDSLHSNCI